MKTAVLSDHAKLIRGITFKPSDKCGYQDDDAVACMRTKNIQQEIDLSDLVGVPRKIVTSDEKIIQEGDILVSSANSWNLVGKCCWTPKLDFAATAGGFISILRPKTDSLDRRFLYHWFSSPAIQHKLRSFGNQTTNISNLNHKLSLALEIPLPPLPEQKRIAAILDAADALRTQRRQSIAELDLLLQSTFLEMFGDPVENPKGWEIVSLEHELEYLTSGSRGWAKHYTNKGDIFIRIQNLKNGKLDLNDIAFVNTPSTKEAERTKVKAGDVLLSITADLGRTAVVPHGISNAYINQHIAILRFKNIQPTFVSYQLASKPAQSQFNKLNKGGVKAGLNFNDIKTIKLAKPPIELQQKFAEIVEAIEAQKERLQAHLAELDTLFAALQQRAFNGEL